MKFFEKDKLKAIIFYFLTGWVLVFSPLARGAVRVWSESIVLFSISALIFIWLMGTDKAAFLKMFSFKDRYNIPVMALSVLAVLSFVFSKYKYDSFYSLLEFFIIIGLFYFIVDNYRRPYRRYVVWIIVLTGAGLSIYGLLQYFNIFLHGWWKPQQYLAATYVNHNHFAGYLEFAIPLSLGVMLRYRKVSPIMKLILIETFFILVIAYIFTQSRAGWVSLLAGLTFMNILLIANRKVRSGSVIVSLLGMLVVFYFIYTGSGNIAKRISAIEDITVSETSFETRLGIWEGTLKMIKDYPLFGVGIGGFDWSFYKYRPEKLNVRAKYAHNDYLQMGSEMGVLAPIIFLWFIFIVIKTGVETADHPVILGCTTGVLSLSIHGLLDFNFHIMANMIVFIICCGFIMAENKSLKGGS